MMDKIKNILWIIPVLFVWTWVVVAPAYAQPELKVGQEVKWDCNTCVYEGNDLYRCTAMLCLGSASRPEFELPLNRVQCKSPPCWTILDRAYEDRRAIADELRHLRKEIEALKK